MKCQYAHDVVQLCKNVVMTLNRRIMLFTGNFSEI